MIMVANHIAICRFMDCEKWRKEFGTDDLPRTFDYKEKPKVFEYYPQYYHKTDKVRHYFFLLRILWLEQVCIYIHTRTLTKQTTTNSKLRAPP